jgi:hypothetical protein
MESEELEWLKKKKYYLEDWKVKFKGAKDALPPIPSYDLTRLSTASSMATSGTASVYNYILGFSKYDTPEVHGYTQTYVAKYDALHEAQQRPQQTRILVEKLKSPSTLDRFDRALTSYLDVKSGTAAPTQAASEIRNLLYGIYGDLLELARKTPKEQITWLEMAKRLAKPGPNGSPRQELAAQEAIYKQLTGYLSEIAKDRGDVSLGELNQTWTQVLDLSIRFWGWLTSPRLNNSHALAALS